MRIANSMNICFGRFPEEDLLPRLAAAGYDGVDFNFWDLCTRLNWHDPAEADPWLATLAETAAEHHLTWVQAHGPVFDFTSLAPGDCFQRELCLPALRACGRLGVPWMVFHPVALVNNGDRRHTLAANVDFFRTLLPACERYGVGIALENIFDRAAQEDFGAVRYLGAVPDELCELIDTLNHPLVGACWDTGHAHIMHLDQRSALAMLGSRLKVLHVHDNDGRRDMHLLPFNVGGRGIQWDALMAGLHDAGFTGALTLEVAAAFNGVPDALFDEVLHASVLVCRQLAGMVTAGAA